MDFSIRIRSLLYFRCNKKKKKKISTKTPKKESKGGKELHRRRLGANNIETGLLSKKVIFPQLQD